MFNIKLKYKESSEPKVGMYFIYSIDIFKITKKIVDKDGVKFNLVYYSEVDARIHNLSTPYHIDFLREGIRGGTYRIIEEINGEVLIPQELVDL